MTPRLLPLLLACALAVAGHAADPAARTDAAPAPAVDIPDLEDIRALPELMVQLGVPHSLIVYGDVRGIMDDGPERWCAAFHHEAGTRAAVLDAWCAHSGRFAWRVDAADSTIIIGPRPDAAAADCRRVLGHVVSAPPGEPPYRFLGLGGITDLPPSTAGKPFALSIDTIHRGFRGLYGYASRAANPDTAADPLTLGGSVEEAFIANGRLHPDLSWHIWTENSAEPTIGFWAMPVSLKAGRTQMTLAHVITNLDPRSAETDGYPHALIRLDDAALELFRRLRDGEALLAECDRQRFFANLVHGAPATHAQTDY